MRKLCLVSVLMMAAAVALAQSGRGVITGEVRDSSGAVIPGTSVVTTNAETGVRYETETNEAGVYSVINLSPGTYQLAFQKAGMQTLEHTGITVAVNQTVRLDTSMQVGRVTESITVSTAASPLNTDTSDVGTTVDHQTILDLPLNIDGGRQLESFAYAIAPAVEGNPWTSYVNGGPAFSKEVVMDGTSAVIQIGGDIESNSPSLEAVQEFKIDTSGMSAEYGRTGGGVYVFNLKSGTNEWHGSGVGFMRNEFLNANSWNNNLLAAENPDQKDAYKRPRDRQWTYAGSIGGPIIRNKTFFFSAFERFQRQDYSLAGAASTVPTTDFLSGNFSSLLDTSTVLGTDNAGNPIYKGAIIDPTTGNVFANNVIPSSRISGVSQKITDIYRQYYQPLNSGLIDNNAVTLNNQPTAHTEQFSMKIDHTFTDRSKASGSFVIVSAPRLLEAYGGVWSTSDSVGGPMSNATWQDVYTKTWRFGHSYMFSPNVLNTFNTSYAFYHNGNEAASAGGNWLQKLGLGSGAGNFPTIDFGPDVNGYGTTWIGNNSSGYYVSNSFVLDDSISWIKGRHSFKFGFDGRLMQLNSHKPGSTTQSYQFSNDQTGAPQEPWANEVGFGFASFLLGAVKNASVAVPEDLYGRRKYFALFAQDDFKVTPRLTLNLGLRWEATTPLTEKYGHWANFEYNLTNTELGIPGALAFAKSGSDSFQRNRDWTQFGPRIGAAYQVSQRVVARASYGMMYLPIGLNYWEGVPYGFAPGYFGVNQVNATGDLSPAFYWDQGYPGHLTSTTKDPNLVQYPMVRMDPNSLTAGRLQQWNTGVEFRLADTTVIGANYIGNHGSRLQSDQFERNQPDAAAVTKLLTSGNEWAWVSDAESAATVGVPYPYAGFSNYAWVALSPYPQIAAAYAPLYVIGVPKGTSSYKALELTFTRTGKRGLTTQLSYTLSRARGNVGNAFEENYWNGTIQDVTKLSYEANQLQAIDMTHVFKGYLSYELPFGKGRPFLSNATRLMNGLVGGWNIAGLVNYHSGLPLPISSNNWYQVWGGIIYPNVDQNGDFGTHFDSSKFNASDPTVSGNHYFNTAAFSNPAYGQFGTGPYYQKLRGFGGKSEDVSMMKNFQIRERTRLQFRMDLLNVLNRHYFNNPITDINSSLFGQVTTVTGQPRTGQLAVRLDF